MSTSITDIGNNFLLLDSSDEFYHKSLTAYIILCTLLNVYVLIPPFFVWFYRKVNHIQTRNYTLILIQCFSFIILCNLFLGQFRPFGSLASRHPAYSTVFGCASTFWTVYLIFPMSFLTLYIRAGQCVLSEAMSRTMLQNLDGKGAPKRKNYGKLDRYAHLVFRYLFTRAVYERNSSNESSSATNSSNASQLFLNSAVNPEEFTMAKVNNSALLRIYAAAFLGEIMLALIPILATISDIQYCNIYTMYIPLYVLLIPAPLFSILLLFVMRDIQDNFHIKFGLAFSFGCILCSQVFYFIAEYPIWIYGYTHIRGVTFLLIAILLVYTVDTVVPVYRAYLQTKTSASVRKDDQDNLTLDQVIDHPVYWVQFQQQIVRDYAGENSQFINDYKRIVAKLKQIESEISSRAVAQADTKNNVVDQSSPSSAPAIPASQGANSTHIHTMIQEIIRNYISPGAPFELNISGKARSSLMGEDKNRKAEGTLLTLQLLEPILKEVKKNLETNSWPRFRATLKNGGNKSPP